MRHFAHNLVMVLLLTLFCSPSPGSGQEIYGYDPAGRLRHIVTPDGVISRFHYDSQGNLVSVGTDRTIHPPLIVRSNPIDVRAGETYTVHAFGENLSEVALLASTLDFSISSIVVDADSVSFALSVSESAQEGEQAVRVVNSDGSAFIPLNVLPSLPLLSAGPLPLALPTDGSVRHISVALSHADVEDRVIGLSTGNTAVAELLATEVTIPAGDTETRVRARGMSGGVTTLTLTSEGLDTATYALYVTAEYGRVQFAFSRLLGTLVGTPETPPSSRNDIAWADEVGVSVGRALNSVEPGAVRIGSDTVPFVIRGHGLSGVSNVAVIPADGLAVSEPVVSADGTAVHFNLSVGAGAPLGPRRIVLSDVDGPYPAIHSGADVFQVTQPPPEIDSIAPTFALRGSGVMNLKVRGRFFENARAVTLEPLNGITVGASPTVSDGGTELTATLDVTQDAPPGKRAVIVTTAAGSNDARASGRNGFTVVESVVASVPALTSPAVGVELGEPAEIETRSRKNFAGAVGLGVGPLVNSLYPRTAEIGTLVDLTLHGQSLEDLSLVRFEPAEGVFARDIQVDSSGKLARIEVEIAADAPTTPRLVRVFETEHEIPFLDASGNQLLVTAPLPTIERILPNTLPIGGGDTLITLHGRNFDHAISVAAIPREGVSFGTPVVDPDGNSLTATVRADAGSLAGPRAIRVVTPAGESTAFPNPSNTLTLFHPTSIRSELVVAPVLGVHIGEQEARSTIIRNLPLTPVGLQVGPSDSVANDPPFVESTSVGLAVGPIITGIETPKLTLGGVHALRLRGQDLGQVDGAAILPGVGVAIGRPVPSADGTEIALSLTVPSDAELSKRQLRLVAGADSVPFADPAQSVLRFGTAPPSLDSIAPIVARPGDTFDLTIRGHGLSDTIRVFAEPPEGLEIDNRHSVDASGTELKVRVHVADDAKVGSRIVRVETLGGNSNASGVPANTLTVY